jgi:hypothetical protein
MEIHMDKIARYKPNFDDLTDFILYLTQDKEFKGNGSSFISVRGYKDLIEQNIHLAIIQFHFVVHRNVDHMDDCEHWVYYIFRRKEEKGRGNQFGVRINPSEQS